jgi:hypothetical protein
MPHEFKLQKLKQLPKSAERWLFMVTVTLFHDLQQRILERVQRSWMPLIDDDHGE